MKYLSGFLIGGDNLKVKKLGIFRKDYCIIRFFSRMREFLNIGENL